MFTRALGLASSSRGRSVSHRLSRRRGLADFRAFLRQCVRTTSGFPFAADTLLALCSSRADPPRARLVFLATTNIVSDAAVPQKALVTFPTIAI